MKLQLKGFSSKKIDKGLHYKKLCIILSIVIFTPPTLHLKKEANMCESK